MILAYAAIFGLVQIVCTWIGTKKLFAHLSERDERHERQVNGLLLRIQAPEVAIAQDIAEDAVLLAPVDAEDDIAMARSRRHRLELAGDEMPIEVPEPFIDDEDLTGVS